MAVSDILKFLHAVLQPTNMLYITWLFFFLAVLHTANVLISKSGILKVQNMFPQHNVALSLVTAANNWGTNATYCFLDT